ncbi:MAG: hypothetical protein HYV28_06250, partial [Ignavibacteriales bacterium]|nr:hypothetical protein [Ignavibacteriales bacterium]
MKTLFNALLLTCVFAGYLASQTIRTFGPVKENNSRCWRSHDGITEQFNTNYPAKMVGFSRFTEPGVNGYEPAGEYRTFLFWNWTSQQIPRNSLVKSIRLQTVTHGWYWDPWYFKLFTINSPVSTTFNFFNACIAGNYLMTATTTRNTWGNALYDNTFTSGPLFDAIQNAVLSGNNYFTLGLAAESNNPVNIRDWWDFLQKERFDWDWAHFNEPACDLTIEFVDANPVTFVNLIENSTGYGSLIVDNNIANPAPSGTRKLMELDAVNHTVRTNELPFVPNYNGTGKTQKTRNFLLGRDGGSRQDVLVKTFTNAQILSSETEYASAFVETENARIEYNAEGLTTSGNIWFKDPWTYTNTGSSNWIQSDEFKQFTAPLELKKENLSDYGGVFLEQKPGFANPYYTIRRESTLTKTINGINCNFQFVGWNLYNAELANPDNVESPVVFKGENAKITANFKGHLLTTSVEEFANAGHRQVVTGLYKGPNNNLEKFKYFAYVSLGKVWATFSTDNGITWAKEVNVSGHNGEASICRNINLDLWVRQAQGLRDKVYLAYQEYLPSTNATSIIVKSLDIADLIGGLTICANDLHSVQVSTGNFNTELCMARFYSPGQPGQIGQKGIKLVFRENETDGLKFVSLNWNVGPDDPITGNPVESDLYIVSIEGTDNNSHNPSIGVTQNGLDGGTTNPLVWEQHGLVNGYQTSDIYYKLVFGPQHWDPINLSYGTGYEDHRYPSVIGRFDDSSSARVVWRAIKPGLPPVQGIAGSPKLIFRAPDNLSRVWVFGHGVFSQQVTRVERSEYPSINEGPYAVSWSQWSGSAYDNYWVDNSLSTSNVKIIPGAQGKNMQLVGEYFTLNNLRAVIATGNDQTGFFKSVPLSGAGPDAVITTTAVAGKVVYPEAGGIGFNYTIGDITVDRQPVSFKETDPDLYFSTIEDLNNSLQSNPFALEDRSEFIYSIICSPT